MEIPGKVLIVDDKREDAVNELVDEFLSKGEHVVLSGLPISEDQLRGVRLLILDYYLFEDSEANSLDAIATIIDDLHKLTKFFMLVVWSQKTTSRNKGIMKEKIIERYKNKYNRKEFPCELFNPIAKYDLGYEKIIKRVYWFINRDRDLSLLFEVEKIVNNAKDDAARRIYDIGSWSNLVKQLKKEYNFYSLQRQLLLIYANMLKRSLDVTKRLEYCIRKLANIEKDFSEDNFAKCYSSQYYNKVLSKELIGTGDVLNKKFDNKHRYIVITPECDIAQDKHTSIQIVKAELIAHDKLKDQDFLKSFGLKHKMIQPDGSVSPAQVIHAILGGKGLGRNYHTVNYMPNFESGGFYHLIINFHKVAYLKKAKRIDDLKGYDRICRIDISLMSSILQAYATQCSRIGTLAIPFKKITKILAKGLPKKIT